MHFQSLFLLDLFQLRKMLSLLLCEAIYSLNFLYNLLLNKEKVLQTHLHNLHGLRTFLTYPHIVFFILQVTISNVLHISNNVLDRVSGLRKTQGTVPQSFKIYFIKCSPVDFVYGIVESEFKLWVWNVGVVFIV
jgi:hypothetical protein